MKTLLEQSDRNRRMLEQELGDSNEQLSELTCLNQSINGAKQKCDTPCLYSEQFSAKDFTGYMKSARAKNAEVEIDSK